MLRPLTMSHVLCLVIKLMLRHECSILFGFASDRSASASGRLVFPPHPIFFWLCTFHLLLLLLLGPVATVELGRHHTQQILHHMGLLPLVSGAGCRRHLTVDLITVVVDSSFHLPTRCRRLVPLRSIFGLIFVVLSPHPLPLLLSFQSNVRNFLCFSNLVGRKYL